MINELNIRSISKTGFCFLLMMGLICLPLFNSASVYGKTTASAQSAYMTEEEILVKFAPWISGDEKTKLNAANGAKEKFEISEVGVSVLTIPKGKSAQEIAAVYQKNKKVLFAEPNYIAAEDWVPDDTYYATSQKALQHLSAPAAWDISKSSSSITVAVLDTGATFNHTDLTGKYLAGYDFINGDSDPTDDKGHGTMVAGIIAANTNNGTGIAGAACNGMLLPVKVLDSTGYGSYSAIAKGIIYAADHGANVINMSLGGTSSSSTLKSAVDYAYNKGVVIVASAGNSNGAVEYPAAYDHVVAVAAIDNNDVKSSYSCYGSAVDLTAPGNSITSTNYSGGYSSGSGTSFSAPFVSALAALIFSVNPGSTPAQVIDIMEKGAVDLGSSGWDNYYGYGRVDYYNSLNIATGEPSTIVTDTTKPVITLTGSANERLAVGDTYTDAGAIATDNVDGDISNKIIATNLVNTSTAGTYTVAYNVTDAAGNKADPVTRTVTVTAAVSLTPTTQTLVYTGMIDAKGQTTVSQSVTTSAAGTLTLNLAWDVKRTNLDLYLYDSSNTLVASSKSSSTTATENIAAAVPAGTYTVKLVSVSGKAKYLLSVALP
jgi:thermitase